MPYSILGSGSGGGGSTPFSVNAQTASYTLINADLGGNVLITMDAATPIDLTVPTGMTNSEPVAITGIGAGSIHIVPAVGVTLLSADDADYLRVQYSTATLMLVGVETYLLVGDITA